MRKIANEMLVILGKCDDDDVFFTIPLQMGPTYKHCEQCERCVKPAYMHCARCSACHLPGRCE